MGLRPGWSRRDSGRDGAGRSGRRFGFGLIFCRVLDLGFRDRFLVLERYLFVRGFRLDRLGN